MTAQGDGGAEWDPLTIAECQSLVTGAVRQHLALHTVSVVSMLTSFWQDVIGLDAMQTHCRLLNYPNWLKLLLLWIDIGLRVVIVINNIRKTEDEHSRLLEENVRPPIEDISKTWH